MSVNAQSKGEQTRERQDWQKNGQKHKGSQNWHFHLRYAAFEVDLMNELRKWTFFKRFPLSPFPSFIWPHLLLSGHSLNFSTTFLFWMIYNYIGLNLNTVKQCQNSFIRSVTELNFKCWSSPNHPVSAQLYCAKICDDRHYRRLNPSQSGRFGNDCDIICCKYKKHRPFAVIFAISMLLT